MIKISNKIAFILIAILILVLSLPIILSINISRINKNNEHSIEKYDSDGLEITTKVFDNKDSNNVKASITVSSNVELEYVKQNSGHQINCNNKYVLGFEYPLKLGTSTSIEIKQKGKSSLSRSVTITNSNILENCLNIFPTSKRKTGYEQHKLTNLTGVSGYNKFYYRYKTTDSWTESDTLTFLTYQFKENGMLNSDDSLTIYLRMVNPSNGDEIYATRILTKEELEIGKLDEDTLFEYGIINERIGGFTGYAYKMPSQGGDAWAPNVVVDNNLLFKITRGASNVQGVIMSNKAIDLTKYNSLVYTIVTTSHYRPDSRQFFGVSATKKNGYTLAVNVSNYKAGFSGTKTVNISSLSGNYYIAVAMTLEADVYISKIELKI